MALSDKELEKVKLMQQFRSGERTDLPDVDSDEFKLSKIKSMLDKEKTNEVGGTLNITDPKNPKLTSFEAMITGAITKAYPSADISDVRDFYRELMDNVKSGRVNLDGLDLGEEFEQFAINNNVLLKDPSGGVQMEETETIDENTDGGVEFFKRIAFKK